MSAFSKEFRLTQIPSNPEDAAKVARDVTLRQGACLRQTPTEMAWSVLGIFREMGLEDETYVDLLKTACERPAEVIETVYRIGLKLPKQSTAR